MSTEHNTNNDSADRILNNHLDSIGEQLRASSPNGINARIEAAVLNELETVTPRPLQINGSPHSKRLRVTAWAGSLAAAAALTVTALITMNSTQPHAQPEDPVALNQAGFSDAIEQLAAAAAEQDLGDWLASMSFTSDSDSILDSGLEENDSDGQFWTVDSVLGSDASLF